MSTLTPARNTLWQWPLALGASCAAMAWTRAFSDYNLHLDYGTILDRIFRIQSGQYPYHDFWCPTTPGTYFLHSLLSRLGDGSLLPLRISMAGMAALFGASAGTLWNRMTLPFGWKLFLACFAVLWAPYSVIPLPFYDADALTLVMGGLAAYVAWFETRRPVWLCLATAAMVGSFLFKQNIGLSAVAALGSAILLFEPRKTRGPALRTLIIALIFLIGVSALTLWASAGGDAHAAWEWIFRRAASGKVQGNWLSFVARPLIELSHPVNRALWLWFACFAAALTVWRKASKKDQALTWMAFVVDYGVVLSQGGGSRFHYFATWLPLSLLLLDARRWSHGVALVLGLALMGQNLRAVTFRRECLGIPEPQTSYAFEHPNLKGLWFSNPDGPNVDHLLKELDAQKKPGETVWVYPAPLYAYWALRRTSPLPTTSYLLGFEARPDDQPDLLRRLEQSAPRWAVLGLDDGSAHMTLPYFKELNQEMTLHYEWRQTFGNFLLLERAPSSGSSTTSQTRISQAIEAAIARKKFFDF